VKNPGRAKPPNIVVILADDLGFGDIGCYNTDCRIPTPNIDALAGRGVRWTDMHTPSAVCTPSRYGMLTGEYCWRDQLSYGVLYGYEPPLIGADQPTLATSMRAAGYRTACIGKWHLGMEFRAKPSEAVDFSKPLPWKGVDTELESRIDLDAPIGGGPITRGFDTFFGTAGCSTAQPPFAFIEQDRFPEAPSEFREKIHFTGRPGMATPGWDHAMVDPTFTERAVSTLRSYANDSNPFFLYLAASAPHEPCLEATVPPFARGMSTAGDRGDLVWLFDWMVGQVVDALERTGQAGNTLLLVTSDNGALPGDRVGLSEDIDGYELYDHLSCGDWRGYKAHIWEGGHRVPFVVGPASRTDDGSGAEGHGNIGAIDNGSATSRSPRVVTSPACLTDLFSTLPSVAGLTIGLAGTDSVDLSELPGFAEWCWSDDSSTGPRGRREALIHHSGFGVFSIRTDEWKLVAESTGSGGWPPPAGTFPVPGGPGQLYNLREDPRESRDLSTERPDIYAALLNQLASYRAGAPTVSLR